MRSDGQDQSPATRTVRLACPKCGAKGNAVWEKERSGQCLASLSGNFYERLAKFAPYRIEIVCHGCGAQAVQSAAAANTNPLQR